ncbi:hypothetical protein J416_07542 [Gracilibacillus halophilus YIM-C55.5]|uniref:DUF2507 domain-containing protein n=1 Tax=Gracilibacillus halophilus YIM-C55.5 TaxID=1308866 RepID=N4WVD6_9BACI|nr:DUF2507 domain-containing protein [Gracilibacillus halophilus]ENH97031.1 hypothetical protein J416_07542 [Gracilibacillus halophilus YIM-C55.5]
MGQKQTNVATILANLHSTNSGYDVLRYFCLPDMLGKEADMVLYMMGKNLARQSECATTQEIQEFFRHTGWGELLLTTEKRKGYQFILEGEVVQARIETIQAIEFYLESGFLAESLTMIDNNQYECFVDLKQDHAKLEVITSS